MRTRFLLIDVLVVAGFPVAFGQYMEDFPKILEERLGTDLLQEPKCIEDKDERPAENFVFFYCKWVEVPHGWIFENGLWQEDPSVQRLGPAPLPIYPRIDVCICSGQYNYYNSTDKQCYSSPYMPNSYQKLCKEFEQTEFAGWRFNSKYCDWQALSDPYENDESMKLASEKVELGGLGIDPKFNITMIIVGIASGVGIAFELIVYWRRK